MPLFLCLLLPLNIDMIPRDIAAILWKRGNKHEEETKKHKAAILSNEYEIKTKTHRDAALTSFGHWTKTTANK